MRRDETRQDKIMNLSVNRILSAAAATTRGERSFVLRLRIATIAMFSEYSHSNRSRDVQCTSYLHANMHDNLRLFTIILQLFVIIAIIRDVFTRFAFAS